MPKIHCLTVGFGDCTIIQHGSGHISMIDICGGNRPRDREKSEAIKMSERSAKPRGNFAMCSKPTNPLDYIENNGLTNIFRFILTHPDMDHLDGFDALMDAAQVSNFWDSGARKNKPDFSGTPYKEDDWDRYVKVREDNESDVTVVTKLAGDKFTYANKDDSGGNGDFTYIVAPSESMIEEANEAQEFNESSYIIVYNSAGGKIVIPGDAGDEAWDYAMTNHSGLVSNVGFLLAPHHGRDSGRDWTFLDHLNPRFSLLGCAPSEHLAYSAWKNRNLDYVTQNQSGNVVLEPVKDAIHIYIENDVYAEAAGGDKSITNEQGYYIFKNGLVGSISTRYTKIGSVCSCWGSRMSTEKSLKSQNLHLIISAIIIHAVLFINISLVSLDLFSSGMQDQIEHLKEMIAPGTLGFAGVLITSLILRGILPSLWRDRLIHWRWRNPLPGSRAFTVIGPRDGRVDMQSLGSRYGSLPTDPVGQDKRFYSIYKEYQNSVGVKDAHKSYLALRDIAVITFLFTPALPFVTYFLTKDLFLSFKYFGVLVLAFVVISWAAKIYAARLVENTLSAAS